MISLPIDLQLNVDGSGSELSDLTYEWLEGVSAQLFPTERAQLAPLPARVPKGIGVPGAIFGILSVSRGGYDAPAKVAERACSAAGFRWLRKELADLPNAAFLEIGNFDEAGNRGRRRLMLVTRHHPASPGWLQMSIMTSDEDPDDLKRLLPVFQATAAAMNPGFGHVSYAYGLGATALEDCLPPQNYPPRQREPEYTIAQSRRYLRGYSWVTIAPQELVARLGGGAGLASTGAFMRVEEMASGGLWLQATERFDEFQGEIVARVFAALAPILRPGLPVSRTRYPGQPPHMLVYKDAATFAAD